MNLNRWVLGAALLSTVILASSGAAFGADINGKWKATFQGGGGDMTIEQTFTFKVDGEKLGGTMNDPMMGDAKIASGSIKGDEIEFTVTGSGQMGEMTLNFKGKVVSADEIHLTMSFNGGGPGGGGPPGGGPPEGGGGPPGGGGGGRGPGGGMELVAKRVK